MNNKELELSTHDIATIAMEAMLYEVSATPKPGLVDRNNCGAHKDMNFFTFMSSAAALHSTFDAMVLAGIHAKHSPITNMWPELRKIGIKAENSMFLSTNNVNTHKGEIFSLGLLCGCAAVFGERYHSYLQYVWAKEELSHACLKPHAVLHRSAHDCRKPAAPVVSQHGLQH